jgi:hypothetical protein
MAMSDDCLLRLLHLYGKNVLRFSTEGEFVPLSCMRGKSTVLTGPSGSGKSTIFRCIFWLLYALEFGPEFLAQYADYLKNRDGTATSRITVVIGLSFMVRSTPKESWRKGWVRVSRNTIDEAFSLTSSGPMDEAFLLDAVRLVPQDHGLRPSVEAAAVRIRRVRWFVGYRNLHNFDQHINARVVGAILSISGISYDGHGQWKRGGTGPFTFGEMSGGQLDCGCISQWRACGYSRRTWSEPWSA